MLCNTHDVCFHQILDGGIIQQQPGEHCSTRSTVVCLLCRLLVALPTATALPSILFSSATAMEAGP
jgi:hypothetical protein